MSEVKVGEKDEPIPKTQAAFLINTAIHRGVNERTGPRQLYQLSLPTPIEQKRG